MQMPKIIGNFDFMLCFSQLSPEKFTENGKKCKLSGFIFYSVFLKESRFF